MTWTWLLTAVAVLLTSMHSTPLHAVAAPGDPDKTFSDDGRLITSFGPGHVSGAEDVVVDANGRIVAVGIDWTNAASGENLALARYLDSGKLDATFSGDGLQTTDVLGDDRARAVAIDPQGRIVVGGVRNGDIEGHPTGGDILVARYLESGQLDPAFGGGDGIATADLRLGFDEATDVAVDSQGRIVAAGRSYIAGESEFSIARFLSDGSPDNGFSGDGIAFIDFGSVDIEQAAGVAVDAQDRVAVAGGSFTQAPNFNWNYAAARLHANGIPDLSFGLGGEVHGIYNNQTDNDLAEDIVIDAAGDLITPTALEAGAGSPGLVKLSGANGAPVAGFGSGGFAGTSVPADPTEAGLDKTGRILMSGYGGNPERLLAWRFDGTTGATDNSFGGDGLGEAEIDIVGTTFTYGGGLAVDHGGRPVVSGGFDRTSDPPLGAFALARFEAAAKCLRKPPTIVGTSGKDVLRGTPGHDTIAGLGGKDRLIGGKGKDRLCGGAGKDLLKGGPGKDRLAGGKGKDRLSGGRGKDKQKQ
jgi:uncharacterized delta-60 repeat protein